jgi:hypothetical protein
VQKVFVSSTFEDLLSHRHAVADALRQLQLHTVEVSELDRGPIIKTSLDALIQADIFIGIYASRYGDMLTDWDISFTELLYDEAVRLDKPRCIYVVDPHETWPQTFLQNDMHDAMMRMFLEKLNSENPHLRSFTSPQDLAEKITFDLARLKSEGVKPRRKWRKVLVGGLLMSVIVLSLVLLLGSLANL